MVTKKSRIFGLDRVDWGKAQPDWEEEDLYDFNPQ